jgi:hypothetical protein
MAIKTTVEFLDEVKRNHRVPSDYALAKLLYITRQQVSLYRTQGNTFSDLTALRVAELLEIEPMAVIAARNVERAKRTEEKTLWEGLARKLVGAAAGLILAGFLSPGGDWVITHAAAATGKPLYMLYAYTTAPEDIRSSTGIQPTGSVSAERRP